MDSDESDSETAARADLPASALGALLLRMHYRLDGALHGPRATGAGYAWFSNAAREQDAFLCVADVAERSRYVYARRTTVVEASGRGGMIHDLIGDERPRRGHWRRTARAGAGVARRARHDARHPLDGGGNDAADGCSRRRLLRTMRLTRRSLTPPAERAIGARRVLHRRRRACSGRASRRGDGQ